MPAEWSPQPLHLRTLALAQQAPHETDGPVRARCPGRRPGLGAGRYLVYSVGHDAAAGFSFDAWNYAGGWLNQYFIWTPTGTHWAGTLNAAGTNWKIFDTAPEALATAQATFSPLTLELATETTVRFGIADSFYGDNSGGISLNVTVVPEPASGALLVAGLGRLHRLVRRRRAGAPAARAASAGGAAG